MSMEELQNDFKAVEVKIMGLQAALTTAPELVGVLKNELLPLMGSMLREMGEQDEGIADLYSQSEDILQPETAGVFATLILSGLALLKKLEAYASKAGDKATIEEIKGWREVAKSAKDTLEEITLPDDEDPENPEDPEEDDEDDDEEEDDKDADKEPK